MNIFTDREKLIAGLNALTGVDFKEAENLERRRGNMIPVINFSTSFQVRLAAMALKTTPQELERLPMKQLNRIILEVSNFLLSDSEEEVVQEKSGE